MQEFIKLTQIWSNVGRKGEGGWESEVEPLLHQNTGLQREFIKLTQFWSNVGRNINDMLHVRERSYIIAIMQCWRLRKMKRFSIVDRMHC